MRYYKSKNYLSWGSAKNIDRHLTTNKFLILSDDERFRLADKIEKLEQDIKTNPLKKRFNKFDKQAVVFLKRICTWTEFEESECIDPTQYQVDTIINKLLRKVYGDYFGEFNTWLQVGIDIKDIDAYEMRDIMDRKRRIVRKMKEKGMLPLDFMEP